MSQRTESQWDEEIRAAIREPIADLGSNFTRSVMNRVGDGPAATAWWSYGPLVGAAAAMAVAIALFLVPRTDSTIQTSAAEQIQSLVQEQQALQRELRDLRHLRASAAPVVYLGGDESVEFVYALDNPRTGYGSTRTADYRPTRN